MDQLSNVGVVNTLDVERFARSLIPDEPPTAASALRSVPEFTLDASRFPFRSSTSTVSAVPVPLTSWIDGSKALPSRSGFPHARFPLDTRNFLG